jgi:phosphatidylserine/phosphatidylglycerophosphate/cardiolipin synthase-like enzyme
MAKRKGKILSGKAVGATGIVGLIVAAILIFLSFVFGVDLLGMQYEGEKQAEVTTANGDWYEIYFTNPDCPPEEARQGGVDETIAADIAQAQRQVDVAAYDFDSVPMIEALIALEGRGVTVRVVIDADNAGMSGTNRLRRNGISVVEDGRSALMHDKFVVIDGRTVWLGSLNFTTNGVYCNNNNVVRIESPQLAANYTAEMDEMYLDRLFGPTSPENRSYESLLINDVRLENHFAPEEAPAPLLAALIDGAQEEVLFLAFSFTQEDIGEAMIGRAEAGVPVRGVFETTGSETPFSYYGVMATAGLAQLQVRQDGNPRIMHHKVLIIDRRIVVFGSFNFTDSANESNDENLVIVTDPTFASYFVEEFAAVWQEAGV